MGRIVMKAEDIHFEDVQGLVRYGYGGMRQARYELLRVVDASAAKEWLRKAEVTNAVEMSPPPVTALNIAFTAPGLKALGLPPAVIARFSHEFRGGMADANRSRQLGDIGQNAPEKWRWGKAGAEPHLMVMFYGRAGQFEDFVREAKGAIWEKAFALVENGRLETCELDRYEPFGFADGISQPEIDWNAEQATRHVAFDYTNISAPGEFLLGHPNEYGKLTDRPLLDAYDKSEMLFPAPEDPAMRDLGRNGTYLVIRQLEQDVRGFWQFAHRQSAGDQAAADALAAKMVGRTREGEPLADAAGRPIPGIPPKDKQNHFHYSGDPDGTRCPFGSHLRRANPRNADFDTPPANIFKKLMTMLGFGPHGFRDDLMSSVRFHRIVRRGREYGDGLTPEAALSPAPPDDPPRGIYFICLNASISRQFEFLQGAWLSGTKFSGLTNESDPLTGTREALPGCPVTANFTMPAADGMPERVEGMPQFVTVRGGAYFFLPGLRALRYIAENNSP